VSAVFPECQTISSRVHSRYARELGDLPWEGIPVRIYLQTRKFFCGGKADTANMPTSLIGLEACSGAHFLGRALRKQGHDVVPIKTDDQLNLQGIHLGIDGWRFLCV
jgi:hypothetical protein